MELTIRSIVLAIILTIILAISNAYLALKLGILTSASIPAAIISMGVLRFFKNSSKLENNIVQTAASAGEAVAGGIVYTVPALIVIGYWHRFNYWENVYIAFFGGMLGVLLSIPLRKILVRDSLLNFPEAHAIATILNLQENKLYLSHIIWGGILGGIFEFLNTGLQWLADTWSYWSRNAHGMLYGWSFGFSQTMLAAGYLIGTQMALSIGIGAFISWAIYLPIISFELHTPWQTVAADAVFNLWNLKLRYIGIGAMLISGLWTLLILLKPLSKSIINSLRNIPNLDGTKILEVDKDMPYKYLIALSVIISFGMGLFFLDISPLHNITFTHNVSNKIIAMAIVIFILIVGGFLSIITAYFSGMVGVSATPGSAVIITGVLLAAVTTPTIMGFFTAQTINTMSIEALVIIIGSIIAGMAAIANDNIQDLKIGYLVGATPWKQQFMLFVGVLAASLVIPPVMQILFDVYGIAGVMPRANMDVTQSLPAPTAALIAGVIQSVFKHNIPWDMLFLGLIAIFFSIITQKYAKNISLLGIAIGMYLPLSSSMPLCVGGLLAYIFCKNNDNSIRKKSLSFIACGMITGSALMDIILSITFAMTSNPNLLKFISQNLEQYRSIFGLIGFVIINILIYKRSASKASFA